MLSGFDRVRLGCLRAWWRRQPQPPPVDFGKDSVLLLLLLLSLFPPSLLILVLRLSTATTSWSGREWERRALPRRRGRMRPSCSRGGGTAATPTSSKSIPRTRWRLRRPRGRIRRSGSGTSGGGRGWCPRSSWRTWRCSWSRCTSTTAARTTPSAPASSLRSAGSPSSPSSRTPSSALLPKRQSPISAPFLAFYFMNKFTWFCLFRFIMLSGIRFPDDGGRCEGFLLVNCCCAWCQRIMFDPFPASFSRITSWFHILVILFPSSFFTLYRTLIFSASWGTSF